MDTDGGGDGADNDVRDGMTDPRPGISSGPLAIGAGPTPKDAEEAAKWGLSAARKARYVAGHGRRAAKKARDGSNGHTIIDTATTPWSMMFDRFEGEDNSGADNQTGIMYNLDPPLRIEGEFTQMEWPTQGQYYVGDFDGKDPHTHAIWLKDNEKYIEDVYANLDLLAQFGLAFEGKFCDGVNALPPYFSRPQIHFGVCFYGTGLVTSATENAVFFAGPVLSREDQYGNIRPYGKGMEYYSDGTSSPIDFGAEVYQGEFKDGVVGIRHGRGTIYLEYPNDVPRHEGEFKDGRRHGQGKFLHKSGDLLVGEWREGQLVRGKMHHITGECFEGDYKDGYPSQGTLTFPNGSKHVGEFKDRLLNGQGFVEDESGLRLEGEFKDGRLQGWGTAYNPDGSVLYKGEFKDGLPYY